MKTVIFLGAGASRAEGAPLQNELFPSYFDSRKDLNYALQFQYRNDQNIESIVTDYFNSFFEIKDGIYPSFEEALGILELDINNSFQHLNYSRDEYKYALIIALAESIRYCLDYKGYDHSTLKNHSKLAYKLITGDLHNEVTIITSNYDLLMDNTLYYAPGIDYGFGDTLNNDYWKLFKLHGSLNWLYCPGCKAMEKFNGEKVALKEYFQPEKIRCGCGNKREAVIIPPTYFKNFENPILINIWNHARESLIEAEHIIFCGYSFPDADIHIKYLLKSAELDPSSQLRKVTLVNHHGEFKYRDKGKYIELKKQELNRFKRFYKCEVVDSGQSFEEFVDAY